MLCYRIALNTDTLFPTSYDLSSSSFGQPKQDVHCEWFYLLQLLPPELQQHTDCVVPRDRGIWICSPLTGKIEFVKSCLPNLPVHVHIRLLCQSVLSHVHMPVVVWSEFNKCAWMSEVFSRVLAGILTLRKPMEIPKTRLIHNAVLVITALAAYNPHHPEQSLHISSFASNICLLTALKLTVFRY